MLRNSREQLESQLQRKDMELRAMQETREESEATNERLRKKLEETHRAMAKEAARRNRDRLAQDSVRLGKLMTVRNGMGPNSLAEVWEKGYAFHELAQQREDLARRRERLEERKKELQKLRRRRGNAAQASVPTFDGEPLVEAAVAMTDDLDNVAEQHAINILQERLKKEESALAEKERLLDAERGSHEKELRRVQCEDRSRFYRELDLPLLGNGRYSLLKLLGQGGFSEVWLALDLITLQEVAVKIHQWNNTWTEERKQSFTRHVARELEIQAGMSHPRVVRLLGTFEIDRFSLATVMEYCRGTDLDEVLKKHRFLPEKEAKAILLQIASGLKYLSSDSSSVSGSSGANNGTTEIRIGGTVWRKRAIIHYDLKPANILFDEMGDAKITDFGLSKVFDETSEGTSMELTSQGAGTYWYLPPECFPRPGEPAPRFVHFPSSVCLCPCNTRRCIRNVEIYCCSRISSKVDVWSLGVIYYQMLFGRRPFGEGMSQQAVFASGAIVRANAVEFPTDPRFRVSDEAKEFIRGCLTHDQALR
jgi:tousled-like kinase